MAFANTVSVGTFSPLLPEIARTQSLADWQLGVLAGAFGFARMLGDVPTGMLAARRLGSTLAAAPILLAAGIAPLCTAGPFAVLLLGRVRIGLGPPLGTGGGLTAILIGSSGRGGSVKLNVYEFAGMAGVLGGLAVVGLMPERWGWPFSLLVSSSPVLISVALLPRMWRWFPDRTVVTDLSSTAPDPARVRSAGSRPPSIAWLMFAMGIIMSLVWASVSQFLTPLRGTREFGLDRAGVSRLLGLSQVVDLLALLPMGWLADRIGRLLVLCLVAASLALSTWTVGLGSFPLFVAGSVFLGLGMAGWMFPLGVIREHTDANVFAWRTGLYRVGVDAAAFPGPLLCGLIGEARTGALVVVVGLVALAAAVQLGRLALR